MFTHLLLKNSFKNHKIKKICLPLFRTPLHFATSHQSPKVCQLLLAVAIFVTVDCFLFYSQTFVDPLTPRSNLLFSLLSSIQFL